MAIKAGRCHTAHMTTYPTQHILKSTGTAYLLWFFLGAFGAHQFYLGKTGRAVSMLLTLGWLTIGLWIDMFTLGKQTRWVNAELLRKTDGART